MADSVEVVRHRVQEVDESQYRVRDDHHKKCMDALIKISKLTRGHLDRSSAGFPYESMSQILYRTGTVMSQIESIAREITG